MVIQKIPVQHRFAAAVALMCFSSILILIFRFIDTGTSRYIFLIFNLMLAALPLLLSWWLVQRVRQFGWASWQQIGIATLWLAFLPNAFYLATDFVHVRTTHEISLIFDIILMLSFMCSGLVLGFLSIFLVHKELIKRFNPTDSYILVSLILLLCSFALYLGRFTRWNTWDILLRPAGLLFDVSDRFINPGAHTQTYIVTFTFFVFLSGLYAVIWQASKHLRRR